MVSSKGEVRDYLQPQFDGNVTLDDTTENDLYVSYDDEDLSEIDVPNGWRMEATPDGIVFNKDLPIIDGVEMREEIETPVGCPEVYLDYTDDVWLQDSSGEAVLIGGGVVDDVIAALEEV